MRRFAAGLLPAFLLFSLTLTAGNAAAQTTTTTARSVLDTPQPPSAPTDASSPYWQTSEDRAFRNLFSQTLVDFRNIASSNTAWILSVGGVAAFATHSRDARMSHAMAGAGSKATVFRPGATIGGAPVQAAGALGTYAVGRLTSNTTLTRLGNDLIRAQIVTQTMTYALKSAVGRTRPDGTRFSFPSGHSATTFASATVLQRNFGWKAGVPAYAVATYVAASRVQAQRHFVSDVTFGAALGIVAGRTVTIGSGEHRFAVSPAAVPGGAGVSFTLLDR